MIRPPAPHVARQEGNLRSRRASGAPDAEAHEGQALLEPPIPELAAREPQRTIEVLLAGYVAGALDPYMHALIESHLILSEENRAAVQALEAKAGEELDRTEGEPMGRAARDQVLAAIYAGGWYGRPRPRKIDPDVPEPLEKLLGMRLDDAPWRFASFGVREHILFENAGGSASLYRIRPSQKLPGHTHEGLEATLVLRGGFSDTLGHYRRGDLALADPTVEHRPVADPNEPCICFAVTDAPLRLTGPVARLMRRVFGR